MSRKGDVRGRGLRGRGDPETGGRARNCWTSGQNVACGHEGFGSGSWRSGDSPREQGRPAPGPPRAHIRLVPHGLLGVPVRADLVVKPLVVVPRCASGNKIPGPNGGGERRRTAQQGRDSPSRLAPRPRGPQRVCEAQCRRQHGGRTGRDGRCRGILATGREEKFPCKGAGGSSSGSQSISSLCEN